VAQRCKKKHGPVLPQHGREREKERKRTNQKNRKNEATTKITMNKVGRVHPSNE